MSKSLAMVLGVVLLAVGVLGLVNNPVLGVFAVDTLHNAVHILSGIIGIVAASKGKTYARLYLIIFGIVYAAVAILGFMIPGKVLGLIVVNAADNYLHAAIALVCLGVGFGDKK